MTRPTLVPTPTPVVDLKPGDLLPTRDVYVTVEVVQVIAVPGEDVQVDVQPTWWSAQVDSLDLLVESAGATSGQWLGGSGYPPGRYLLTFSPDAEVNVDVLAYETEETA